MNDKEKIKIDVLGTVGDTAKETATHVGGMLVVALLIGWLVAPIFLPLFQDELDRKYLDPYGNVDSERVAREMQKIRRRLWILAIIGWIVVFLCNLYPYR